MDSSARQQSELDALRIENASLRREIEELRRKMQTHNLPASPPSAAKETHAKISKLSNGQIQRYSRQLILANFATRGQIALTNCSMLIIGAGGIGSPAALYLGAAGVGTIGIVDHDVVDLSNLHRQISHNEGSIGIPKAVSACEAVNRLNSSIRCVPHNTLITSANALDIIKPYDIVLDASDNVATRYLISDACVMLSKPLVSASALRFEGQVTVYNYQNGPCYRCIFPSPPPAETVNNCSDVGVLGVIPGISGCVQALEALKIAIGTPAAETLSGKLLMFDGLGPTYRVMKLRGKNPECASCGSNRIRQLIDYELWCGSPANDSSLVLRTVPLPPSRIVSCQWYAQHRQQNYHLLLDVRENVQFDICSLEPSLNVPLKQLPDYMEKVRSAAGSNPVYVICRRGIDSVTATHLLLRNGIEAFDIAGGLREWSSTVDPQFPKY